MKCSYCNQEEIDDIQERIIREDARDKKWSAFVPIDPEIFDGRKHKCPFWNTFIEQ